MVGLGDLPGGGFWSSANGVSADGLVVVGSSLSASDNDPGKAYEAFRWTSSDGMVGLGRLEEDSEAIDVSADGSVIVGESRVPNGGGDGAFLWTNSGGMQNLRDLLIAGGVTGLTNWTLSKATGISADGRTFVGTGINPSGRTEAWIATIPEPLCLVLALCGFATLVGCGRRRGRR